MLLFASNVAFGPLIAGLKDSSGDMSQALGFAKATGGVDADFDVYPSSEAFLFEGLAGGCAGIISGSTNAFGAYAQKAKTAGPDSDAFALGKSGPGSCIEISACTGHEANRSLALRRRKLDPPGTTLNSTKRRSASEPSRRISRG